MIFGTAASWSIMFFFSSLFIFTLIYASLFFLQLVSQAKKFSFKNFIFCSSLLPLKFYLWRDKYFNLYLKNMRNKYESRKDIYLYRYWKLVFFSKMCNILVFLDHYYHFTWILRFRVIEQEGACLRAKFSAFIISYHSDKWWPKIIQCVNGL